MSNNTRIQQTRFSRITNAVLNIATPSTPTPPRARISTAFSSPEEIIFLYNTTSKLFSTVTHEATQAHNKLINIFNQTPLQHKDNLVKKVTHTILENLFNPKVQNNRATQHYTVFILEHIIHSSPFLKKETLHYILDLFINFIRKSKVGDSITPYLIQHLHTLTRLNTPQEIKDRIETFFQILPPILLPRSRRLTRT